MTKKEALQILEESYTSKKISKIIYHEFLEELKKYKNNEDKITDVLSDKLLKYGEVSLRDLRSSMDAILQNSIASQRRLDSFLQGTPSGISSLPQGISGTNPFQQGISGINPNKIDILEKKINQLTKSIDPKQLENLGEKIEQVEKFLKTAEELKIQKKELQIQIEETAKNSQAYAAELETNKNLKLDTSLGESFRTRKEELMEERKSYKCIFNSILVFIFLALLGLSIFYIIITKENNIEWWSFILNASLSAPLWTLIWFALRYYVRRINEYDHLIEEYSNKQALSLSFARYKATFEEIAGKTNNWEALETFTNSTASELIKNPCHVFPKNKKDRIPIYEIKKMFQVWDILPESNQSALLEALKFFIEKNTELEKRKTENRKQVSLAKHDPYYNDEDEDVPF